MPIPQLANKTKSPQSWKNNPKKKRNKGKKGGKKNFFKSIKDNFSWKKLILIIAGLFLLGGLTGVGMIFYYSRDLPRPDKLLERQVAESTKIYDRTGETVIYEVHGEVKRTMVELEQIPDHVKNAHIAIEDKDFYHHQGFSLWAIFRTAVTNVLYGQKAGGSTLTQQFVKNAVLTSEKRYTRKLKELIMAYRLEKEFSKDEILRMYLNEIPYGSNAYGVEAASRFYFGKSVSQVGLAEGAVLAALPQAPTKYSPYGPNKQLLLDRQKYILDLMAEQGYISQEEAEEAKGQEIVFQERIDDITAPHFVLYVKEILAEKYGQKTIEQGGLKITTTLDLYKHKIAEDIIKEIGEKNAEQYEASNASLVSMDPKTGEVLVMIGSRDYFNDDIDGQVNVALKPRQPGSSFKPFVYTAAFARGYTPMTKVYDVVTNFGAGNDNYEPHNYDLSERGPVSFRQALAGSLNIPAVKAMYLAGTDNVLDLARALGYTTLEDKERFGLSLVLGGGEVKLIEHTTAYGALAREGVRAEPVFVLKVEDNEGNVLEEWEEPTTEEVIDPNIARMTTDILSDNQARAFTFGTNSYLQLGDRPVAAKTGTTNDYRDAWTMGYTPSLVTGVWVGNNDFSKMARGAGGSRVAGPIWNAYMKKVLGDTPIEYFNEPNIPNTRPILMGQGFDVTKVKIDKASGLLATENTPPEMVEERSFFQPHSILYYVNTADPAGPAPENPADDPQFVLWENGISAWIEKQKEENPEIDLSEPPTEEDNLHRPENKPVFSILGLRDGMTIDTPTLNLGIQATAPRGIDRAEYYMNGSIFAINYNYPFKLNRSLSLLPNGNYDLRVRLCDDVSNCSHKDYQVTLNLSGNQPSSYNISWATPADNAAIERIGFPVIVKANLINPSAIAEVSFYYRTETGEEKLIQTKKLIRNSLEHGVWELTQDLKSGQYQLFARATDWLGESKATDFVTVELDLSQDE